MSTQLLMGAFEDLVDNGLSETLAKKLLFELPPSTELRDQDEVEGLIGERLAKLIEFKCDIEYGSVLAFVGSSGVGKSTSVGRLAWKLHTMLGLKVGVIMLEDEGLPASSSLWRYLGKLKIKKERIKIGKRIHARLKDALKRFSSQDVVLIDMPAMEAIEEQSRIKLNAALDMFSQVERILVAPAASGHAVSDLLASGVYARVLISKFDQAYSVGNLLNCIYAHDVPVGFISFGTTIVEEIEPASARRLASVLSRLIH